MLVNGFIVVRLPRFNYREIRRNPPRNTRIPVLGDVYYAGIDRQQWADVFDEDYYAKATPQRVARIAREVRQRNDDLAGIDVCQDPAAALDLLSYSNRGSPRNELIAVRSTSLDALKGTVESDLEMQRMGYDFFAIGEWSLVAAGLFMYPEQYGAWRGRINGFGLFDDSSLAGEYAAAYSDALRAGQSEPLGGDAAGPVTITVEILRVTKV